MSAILRCASVRAPTPLPGIERNANKKTGADGGSFENALAACAVFDRRADQDQRRDQRIAPERWRKAVARAPKIPLPVHRRRPSSRASTSRDWQQRQPKPEHGRDQCAIRVEPPVRVRRNGIDFPACWLSATVFMIARDKTTIDQGKNEDRHDDQCSPQGNPASGRAARRRGPGRFAAGRWIRKEGIRQALTRVPVRMPTASVTLSMPTMA